MYDYFSIYTIISALIDKKPKMKLREQLCNYLSLLIVKSYFCFLSPT